MEYGAYEYNDGKITKPKSKIIRMMRTILKLSSCEYMDQEKTYRRFHKQIYSEYDMKQCK